MAKQYIYIFFFKLKIAQRKQAIVGEKIVSPSEFTVKQSSLIYMFFSYLPADTPLCAQPSQLFKQDLKF